MTTTSVTDALIGHALNGRYEVQARLARGGMATVYRAQDLRLGRVVAVKVMHDGLGDDTDFAKKFDREARAAARLSHPNVVSVFDQGHDRGRPYIVMEYVEGTTLRSVIARDAPLTPLRALDLLDPVLSALAVAHEAGLVHRDVKPENVLISTRGHLKVADFGLAKALSSQTATATQGLLIGTVSYVPPELVMSGHSDTRSDVYSTGVVLFEMLTGRKPHTGDSPIQVAYAHVHNDVPPPSSLTDSDWRRSRDAIPPYLDALVQAATAREPDARPRDARVLQEHLRRARAALIEGVMDDEELTLRCAQPTDRSGSTSVPAGSSAAASLPRGGLSEDTFPRRRGEPARVAEDYSDLPRTPSSPQDFEHTLPPSVRLGDEATPTDLRVSDRSPVRGATRVHQAGVYRRRRRAVALLLVAALLLGVGGWWLLAGRWTTTPALAGEVLDEAQVQAADAGVKTTTVEEYSETVAQGEIIATVPGAGERARRGSTVRVVVSRGPERYPVPTLVGSRQSEAQTALAEANLRVGAVRQAWSETVPDGTVVRSSIRAGRSVKPGTSVDLTVSKGPQPIRIVDYQGRDAAAAEKALEKAGFAVSKNTENSKTVDRGDVISQTPAGATGHRGDTVKLVISKGPVMKTVPNVHKQGVAQAKAAMTKAGFKVSVKPVKENYLGLGYVSTADPGFGARAPEGSTVTLYVV